MASADKTSLKNEHLPNGDSFAILAFCSQSGPVGAPQNLTQRMEDLIFSVHVVCVVVVENLNLSFGRLRQKILLKCVSHVQHDYFSSFNLSDYSFLALSLPLLSVLINLPRSYISTPSVFRLARAIVQQTFSI